MSTEKNKAKERRIVEEALNKGNLAVVDESLAPDFVYHGPGGAEVKGPEGYKQFLARLRTAYPDIHVKIENIVAEADKVATRYTCTFTFTGQTGTVFPTGNRVSMIGTILDRFKANKIIETWEVYDRLDLFQQLGITPPVGQGSR
jgi:predicted ester cyclase